MFLLLKCICGVEVPCNCLVEAGLSESCAFSIQEFLSVCLFAISFESKAHTTKRSKSKDDIHIRSCQNRTFHDQEA